MDCFYVYILFVGTWSGIVGGGITGAFLPYGFVASAGVIGTAGTIGLGATAGYATAAQANADWRFWKWNFEKPGTYNALFQGFSAGSSIVGGLKSAHVFAEKFSKAAKYTLLGTTYAGGVGFAYGSGVMANNNSAKFWEWDWTNPESYNSLVNGFSAGSGWPTSLTSLSKGAWKTVSRVKIGKLLKQPLSVLRPSTFKSALTSLKSTKSNFYKVVGSIGYSYLSGAFASGSFDPGDWDFGSFHTYQSLFDGALTGKEFSLLMKASEKAKTTNGDSKTSKTSQPLFSGIVAKSKQFFRAIRGIDRYALTHIRPILRRKLIGKYKDLIAKEAKKVQKQRETHVDRDTSFGSCGGRTSGRRKRSRKLTNCIVPITTSLNDVLAAETEFALYPVKFLLENPITMQLAADTSTGASPSLNTGRANFQLRKIKTSQNTIGEGFAIINTDSPDVGFPAHYLNTKDSITIPRSPDTNGFEPLLVTTEMAGCTLYVRYNQDGDSLTVYHHHRYDNIEGFRPGQVVSGDDGKYHFREYQRNMADGTTQLVERVYDDALTYEKYTFVPEKSKDTEVTNIGVSSVFMVFIDGRWNFVNQRIVYHVRRGSLLPEMEIGGFSMRPVLGVPEFFQNLI